MVGRVAASDTRDLQFESHHWQKFFATYQLHGKDESVREVKGRLNLKKVIETAMKMKILSSFFSTSQANRNAFYCWK